MTVLCTPSRRPLKLCGFRVLVVLTSIWLIYFLNIKLPSQIYRSFTKNGIENRISPDVEANQETGVKTILFWTKMWDSETFYLGAEDMFGGCEVSACRATRDRNLTDIEDYDALIFHGIQIEGYGVPSTRSMKQKYIFADLEAPVTRPLDSITSLNGFYNWTMTYRRDSDILMPYGLFLDAVTRDVVYPLWARTKVVANDLTYEKLRFAKSDITIKGKTKPVAWFVSHCATHGQRDKYVAELGKHINISIYGACGSDTCPNNDDACYKMLEARYYFYLSFENSICQDYVTEKLYRFMQYNVVPIVYGGANYSEFAPPGSYINVADFESPQRLAEHLRYLISNPKEYAKFFWWKHHFTIESNFPLTACRLCKILHDKKSLAPSTITDLKKWWADDKCLEPADYFKKIDKNRTIDMSDMIDGITTG